jgi:ferredoxin--NADP+ reductase
LRAKGIAGKNPPRLFEPGRSRIFIARIAHRRVLTISGFRVGHTRDRQPLQGFSGVFVSLKDPDNPIVLQHELPEKPNRMSAFHREKVLSVRHWTDTLFSFTATRNSGFRFLNGQFAMIGLEVEGRPLLRAYSMASANHEESLEFFSIKVADGPLTSRLQRIKEGDTILVGRKATGTLIADNLIPGNRLLLLSTGTGLAPFASLIKDPEVYERFETIVLVHGCRQVSELAYGEELVARLRDDELFGPLLADKLVYYPTVTREPFRNRGRITDLITSQQLFDDIGQPPLDIATDRIMMCGSPAMLEELREMFENRDFLEGSHSEPGHFVIEKAFVER